MEALLTEPSVPTLQFLQRQINPHRLHFSSITKRLQHFFFISVDSILHHSSEWSDFLYNSSLWILELGAALFGRYPHIAH